MNKMKSIAQISIGVAFGVGLVLSCSDNSPHRTDAATCDCPASEAPIAGRIVIVERQMTLIGNSTQTVTAACDPGTQFLSGSCANGDVGGDPTALILHESGFRSKSDIVWGCSFTNALATQVQAKASVVCLAPKT